MPSTAQQLEPATIHGVPVLLNAADLARAVGCARTQVMRMVSEGKLPEPVINESRFKRWHPDDVNRWLDRRRRAVAL